MTTIRDLRKFYGELPVLGGVSLDIGEDEIVALIGPSGCGKTTILDIIAGFVAPDSGEIDTKGSRIGYVFQEDRLLPWLTVAENVDVVGDGSRPEEVARILELVGLDGFAGFYPDALSGGMRQRCAIARAYHFNCDLLLMDEPFKSLDHRLRREMLAVTMDVWRRRRNSVLFVTHDIDEAIAMASRIIVLGEKPAKVIDEHLLEPVRYPRPEGTDDLLKARIVAAIS